MGAVTFRDATGELGTARLIDGWLRASTPSLQDMIDSRARALDLNGRQQFHYYSSWSNGYIHSQLVAETDDPTRSTPLVRTTGIDLAAAARGTAIVAIDWQPTGARAHLVCDPAEGTADTASVLAALADGDKIGIDCPFGWPVAFLDALTAHRDRDPWPTGPDVADRRHLRLRTTDRHIADRHEQNPLSVSTDRIASTAMRWASLASSHEEKFGPIDRTGGHRLVEVYPALSLAVWAQADPGPHAAPPRPAFTGYRGNTPEGLETRRRLLDWLVASQPKLTIDETVHTATEHPAYGDDTVDALLAALTAAAAATPGASEPAPPPDTADGQLAALEGWIRVPTPSSLQTLEPRADHWQTS